jgi:hypothetical protein
MRPEEPEEDEDEEALDIEGLIEKIERDDSKIDY